MSARDRILAKLPDGHNPELRESRYCAGKLASDLVSQFEGRFLFHLGEIWSWSDLGAWSNHPTFIEQDAQHPGLTPVFTPVDDLWQAELAITSCSRLIAETGTIVIEATPAIHRLSSLCPEIHVVIASKNQIISNLDDALATQARVNTVWITGPSRTADIEGILVPGIHGPKRVALIWSD